MPSAAEIRATAARRKRRAVKALAVLCALVAATVAASVLASGGDGLPSTAAPGAPGASAPATARPTGPYVDPRRWIALPRPGTRVDQAFPARFPHAPQGAAAAIAAAVEHGWDLDPARAARAAQVYAHPAHRAAVRRAAAANAQAWRERLGGGGTGSVQADMHVRARPVAVQWKSINPDLVRVSLLARVESTAGAELYSITSDMAWRSDVRGGDWVNLPSEGRLPAPEPAEIGTEGFNTAGWTAIEEADQ